MQLFSHLLFLFLLLLFNPYIKQRSFILAQPSQKLKFCAPDSNLFRLKRVLWTMDPEDDVAINKLTSLTKCQYINWLYPHFKKIGYSPSETIEQKELSVFKLISFQNRQEAYSSIILMTRGTEPVLDDEQHLITVENKTGKYIDGILVGYIKNLSNSDLEFDTIFNIYTFSTKTKSSFNDDTIKVIQESLVSYNADSHEEKDYWQEIYETIYLIQPDGRLAEIRERKKLR